MLMNKIPEGDSKADLNKRNKIFEIFDADSSGEKDGLVLKRELVGKIKEWSNADNLMDLELGLDFVWTYLLGDGQEIDRDQFHEFLKLLKKMIRIWMVFHKVDISQDSLISIDEFVNSINNGELDDIGLADLH